MRVSRVMNGRKDWYRWGGGLVTDYLLSGLVSQYLANSFQD